jgi:hypothetical protein
MQLEYTRFRDPVKGGFPTLSDPVVHLLDVLPRFVVGHFSKVIVKYALRGTDFWQLL